MGTLSSEDYNRVVAETPAADIVGTKDHTTATVALVVRSIAEHDECQPVV